ncbi:SHM4 [Symbiodinium sp. CCMP2456]|nr:SHM4 [Symbiodinium sp. CCMP2456]
MAPRRSVSWLLLAANLHLTAGRGITITPSSISAKKQTQLTFTGAKNGDKVFFTKAECSAVTDDAAAVIKNGRAAITVAEEASGLKLCLKPAGGAIAEQAGVSLNVIKPTPPSVVESVSRSSITRGVTTSVTLKGAEANAKAVFVPVEKDCSDASPKAVLNVDGKGSFTIPTAGKTGEYKLCYQSPGGSDSVQQTAAKGVVKLQVQESATTSQDEITGISPSLITVNVPTVVSFTGAATGDKAVFVHSASSDCAAVTPEKDVGAGHAMFTITTAGEYTLCYRSAGAQDSVAQNGEGVKLQVKAPGVTKEMVGRWQSKEGQLDCTSLTYVPYCGVSQEEKCSRTYMVQSGIGYKCSWNLQAWPPKCTVESATDVAKICMSGRCANDACW